MFFNCVSCALAKRTLAQPQRIPFLARWLCLCVVMASMERLHGIKDTQGGGGADQRDDVQESHKWFLMLLLLLFSVCRAELCRPQTPSRAERQKNCLKKGGRVMREAFEMELNSNGSDWTICCCAHGASRNQWNWYSLLWTWMSECHIAHICTESAKETKWHRVITCFCFVFSIIVGTLLLILFFPLPQM